MNGQTGRIIVILRPEITRQLVARLEVPGAPDVTDLRTAAMALGPVAVPLMALLDKHPSITSRVANSDLSLSAELRYEREMGEPFDRGLLGTFILNTFELSKQERLQVLADLESLHALVLDADLESGAAEPAASGALVAPSYVADQKHLKRAPEGIGLEGLVGEGAWNGTGVGLGVIDLDWNLRHEVLCHVSQDLDNGLVTDGSDDAIRHGTAALAVVLARPGFPVLGIAPGSSLAALASPLKPSGPMDVSDAIQDATKRLKRGDVLLLEIQWTGHLPVEVQPLTWKAIDKATRKGIVVVEPAGNGQHDLEAVAAHKLLTPAWNQSGVPHLPIPDSGAIMVSGCTTGAVKHSRNLSENHGDRIDSYAYGDRVVTAGATDRWSSLDTSGTNPNKWYQRDFGGTSAAAAIIAGVILRIQSLAQLEGQPAFLGGPLSPGDVRRVLRDPAIGTAINGAPGRFMPDLARLPGVLAGLGAGRQ